MRHLRDDTWEGANEYGHKPTYTNSFRPHSPMNKSRQELIDYYSVRFTNRSRSPTPDGISKTSRKVSQNTRTMLADIESVPMRVTTTTRTISPTKNQTISDEDYMA